jgi:hypothetical protein
VLRVGAALDDAEPLEVVDELGHGRERHPRLGRQLGETRPVGLDVRGDVGVRNPGVREAGCDEAVEQLDLERPRQMHEQLPDVEAVG